MQAGQGREGRQEEEGRRRSWMEAGEEEEEKEEREGRRVHSDAILDGDYGYWNVDAIRDGGHRLLWGDDDGNATGQRHRRRVRGDGNNCSNKTCRNVSAKRHHSAGEPGRNHIHRAYNTI